jgi:His/Glu/Gln/Arg/opine family amino acid ABC transporter permease subunit
MESLAGWLSGHALEFAQATAWTVATALAAALGALVGGSLLFFLSWSSGTRGQRLVGAYVQLFRNTPVLLPIYLLYFGLPMAGLPWPAVVCGTLAIILQSSAFVSEILRGSYNSIDKIQFDAARSLGLSNWVTFRKTLVPQVYAHSLPALGSQAVLLMKDTSLLSAITVFELVMNAKLLTESSGLAYMPFLTTAAVYLFLVWLIDVGFMAAQRSVRWR